MNTIEQRVIGLGMPIIDRIGQVTDLPQDLTKEQLLELTAHISPQDGGVIPNVLSTLAILSDRPDHIHLLACRGNDIEGWEYEKRLPISLQPLQVAFEKPTASLFHLFAHDGQKIWRFYPEAATLVCVPVDLRRELAVNPTYLFLTDINSLRTPNICQQATEALSFMNKENGLFIMNFSGAIGIEVEILSSLLEHLPFPPHIIFGNEEEFININKSRVKHYLSDALVSVRTQGKDGAMIRFREKDIRIAPHFIPEGLIINDVGCGDSFMGAMLSVLFEKELPDWTANDILEAANFAAIVSAQVLMTAKHRLSLEELLQIKERYRKTGKN